MKSSKFIIIVFLLVTFILFFNFNLCFAITTDNIKYVTGYNDFHLYATSDFSQFQYGNNCAPTAIANIIEYYCKVRGVNMYSGYITQSMYDQICADCNYSIDTGTVMINAVNRIKKICF